MKIHNIRFGFACNSSSTHSFIMFPNGHQLEDEGDVISNGSNNYTDHYGDSPFVLASRQAKLGYIGVLLQEAVKRDKVPEYIWDYYVKDWLEGVTVNRDGQNDDMRGFRIPRCFGSDLPNKEFFDECKRLLLDERVAILSSADEDIIEADESMTQIDKLLCSGYDEIARKDPVYGYWTLFDPVHGSKLRFSFTVDTEIKCASLPELVDLKITDYCQKGCGYCYQKSGRNGENADYYEVVHLIEALARLEVFEIALGGGEPTTHPQFIDILKECKEHGIVPNFTTRNYDWFRNPHNIEVFEQCCGRAAFSADSNYDINQAETIRNYWRLGNNISVQVIDKVSDVISLAKTAKKHNLDLTLLGFKATERGGKYKFSERQTKQIVGFDAIRELYGHRIDTRFYSGTIGGGVSVDTKYLADHLDEIQKAGIEPRLYTVQEGVFSMYIDAVQRKMGPSSYCSAEEQVALDVDRTSDFSVSSLTNQIQTFFQSCSATLAKTN